MSSNFDSDADSSERSYPTPKSQSQSSSTQQDAEQTTVEHADIELARNNLRQQQSGGGNGSEERYIDSETPQENDGRSKTVTGFDPRDTTSQKVYRQGKWIDKWKWLNQLNDGVQDKNRGKQNWRAGKINDAELIANRLELTRPEKDKLKRMADEIDFNRFGSYKTEQVLLACASLVSDENTTIYENRIILQESFKEMIVSFEMGSKDHQQIRQAIRERTEYF
jgi:hypothetical protein